MDRPNILLITSDQQRFDAVGYDNPKIKTPNIDALAKRGIIYERAYTPSPTCTPARCSLLTSQYPSRHGCYMIGTSLPEDYPLTIPRVMSEAGYFTSLIGKGHFQACLDENSFEGPKKIHDLDFFRKWSGPFYGFDYVQLVIGHSVERHAASMHYGAWLEDQGVEIGRYFGNNKYTDFGVWDLPEEYHNSKWTADETIRAIEKAGETGKPFYIWSSFQDPHNPCMVPEPWASMYRPEDVPVYGYREGENDEKPAFYEDMVRGGNYGDSVDMGEKPWNCVTNLPLTVEQKQDIMGKYYGMVSLMDHHIGRIVSALEEKGLMENTVVIFTSDHGDYMGNHGMWWKGLPAYEDAMRVPMVVTAPGCRTPGARSRCFQNLVDYGTTFLSLAGITPPPLLQGVDQSEAWRDASAGARDWSLTECRPSESPYMQKSFLFEKYKLIVYHDTSIGELYDLEADPEQYENLWTNPEFQELKARLMHELVSAEMEKEGVLRTRVSPA